MIDINIVIWWPVIHKVRYMYFQIFTERIFFLVIFYILEIIKLYYNKHENWC